MNDRVILHCDCNSFFASVETVFNPEYKNVPMAVCGSEENRHGIVLAKNELAKKYGIVTAETVFSARKKCPNLVIAAPHHERYKEYSQKANKIFRDYTDMVESFGIDESWLDVTSSGYLGTGEEIAEKIRKRVKNELGITVSVGVSFNKAFAKLGSDYKKPDAVTVINRENYKEIVYPLPVSDLLFVGRKTTEELNRLGIHTIGDLAETALPLLVSKFGKNGELLYRYSRGEDTSPVTPMHEEDAKSVSNGFTFKHNLQTTEECRAGIDYLSHDIAAKLRRDGMKCCGISLTIKDALLHSVQHQGPLSSPTDDSRIIADAAYYILKNEWADIGAVRSITVTAINLIRTENITEQLDFFSEAPDEKHDVKNSKREDALDEIRKKFGNDSIINASFIATDIGVYNKRRKK